MVWDWVPLEVCPGGVEELLGCQAGEEVGYGARQTALSPCLGEGDLLTRKRVGVCRLWEGHYHRYLHAPLHPEGSWQVDRVGLGL